MLGRQDIEFAALSYCFIAIVYSTTWFFPAPYQVAFCHLAVFAEMSVNIGPPTKREIWLSVVLLVSLLLFTRVNYTAKYHPSYLETTAHKPHFETTAAVIDTPSKPTTYRTKSYWGSAEVPSTQILVHVAGP